MLPYDLHEDLDGKLNLTDDQIRAIAGRARTACAFPLRIKETQRARAVLIMEDRRGLEDSDLRRMGIQAMLEKRVVAPIEEQLNFSQFSLPPGVRDAAFSSD